MTRKAFFICSFSILTIILGVQICYAGEIYTNFKKAGIDKGDVSASDTIPPKDVIDLVNIVIYSTNKFNIDAVANLYTPNAVIADDEPPYSWNGPTAGVQWVNAVEQACKENDLTKLKASIEHINVYQQTSENAYIVVPVRYTGNLPGRDFISKGAFTFVLRLINGKWLIKSQVWMPEKGL